MDFIKFRVFCSQLEDVTFEHADEFSENFCKFQFSELIRMRYSSSSVEFVYLTDSGQHILDAIKWEEYQDWIESKMPR